VKITPRHILVAGWVLAFMYAYPGYMSTDSIDQLQQARSGVYTDWHPPVMALIWGVFDRFVSGPVLMLVLQLTLFMTGTFKLLERVLPSRVAAIVTVAIIAWPPVLTPMAVIWKDSQMAGFLVAGAAAVLSPHRGWKIAGWLFLGIAAAMRHNAPAAILPLSIYLVWLTSQRPRLARIAIGVAAAVGLFVGSSVVNTTLTDKREFPWYGSLAMFDIVGTTRYMPAKTDDEMRHLLRDTPLVVEQDIYRNIRLSYNPRTWWWYTHGTSRVWDPPMTKKQRLALRRVWVELVTAYPGAYWDHRRRVFNEVLGRSDEERWSPVWNNFSDSPERGAMVGHNHKHSDYQEQLAEWFFDLGEDDFPYAVYWYFWLSFVLVGVAIWRKQGLMLAFVTSGIAYELTYFFLAPSPDYRYSHWLVACVFASVLAGGTRHALERWNRSRKISTAHKTVHVTIQCE
jgi:hypothetical protein